MAESRGSGPGWRTGWVGAAVLVLVGVLTSGRPVGLRGAEPGADRVVLHESVGRGSSSRVRIELRAQGLFRPALPPGQMMAGAKLPKPLALDVQTRLVYSGRVLELVPEEGMRTGEAKGGATRGRPRKEARHVIQAASAVNGEIRPFSAMLRPEVALLVAERRVRPGPVVVMSPAGPLTRSELELVQGLGDPLALSDLLPGGPVAAGQSWRVGDPAAQAVCGYDAITTNGLKAVLESCDGTRARVRLTGRIQGSALGGEGAIACEGVFTFDRRLGWIDRLELNRNENRQPGPIEAGLDVKSTLTFTRHPEEPPATLTDAALSGLPLEVTPARELLLLTAPGGRASLLHDRHWHTFWDDPKLVVLKRLESGQVTAQCNLAAGPAAARGRHQDPSRFRDEIRLALKQRFVQFLGAGEVDGDPAGGYRYKVAVQGREGDLGVLWYYYLIASPAGDQLLATFTLAEQQARAFASQDLELIGSLRWSVISH